MGGVRQHVDAAPAARRQTAAFVGARASNADFALLAANVAVPTVLLIILNIDASPTAEAIALVALRTAPLQAELSGLAGASASSAMVRVRGGADTAALARFGPSGARESIVS